MMYRRFFKRAIDITASAGVLIILFLPLSLISLWLHFANKGAGAFFKQERPGKGGKIFKVVKFKTMTDDRDAEGNLLPDEKRLTKVGRLVRSTSIDELPQLWNVLKGDMSLIGPRPLLVDYLLVFDDFQKRRMEVRPGITGWAQIHGRNRLKLSKKFELDVWYVDNVNFLLDTKIVWKTLINTIKHTDVGQGNADMKDIDDLGMLDKIIEIQNEKRNR